MNERGQRRLDVSDLCDAGNVVRLHRHARQGGQRQQDAPLLLVD